MALNWPKATANAGSVPVRSASRLIRAEDSLAPIVLERCVRDIEFPGAGDPDWVDHHDRAAVLKDVRWLEVAVQGDDRTALSLFEQCPAQCLQGRYVCDGGVDARTPVSEPSPARARGSVKRVKEER